MIFTKNDVISPQQARRIMKQTDDFVLLDVRTPSEYRQKRLDGAKLLPVDQLEQLALSYLPDKQSAILVYCQSGIRAQNAVKILSRMGYTGVVSFGGITDWPYETISG